MPRRGFVPKREVLPDPVHGTTVVTKLINQIMLDGKRGVAQNVCYEAFDTIKEKTGKDANEVFQAALANVAPSLEVKARRKRGEKTMAERLAAEIMDAANNTGAAVKRKEEMHRMAEANKAFAHYRW